MSLYDLTKELVTVNDQIIEAEGVLSEDLEGDLDRLNLDISVKAVSIGHWILNIGADIPGIKGEIERLTLKKRFAENLSKRLKEYVRDCMIATGKKKIETSTLRITVNKTNPSVEIEDEDAIPARFKTAETVVAIDKKELLKELKVFDIKKQELEKSGQSVEDFQDIPGARLIKDKKHLRVG